MTSSSESMVVPAAEAEGATPFQTQDLASGEWTRLGGSAVLGDTVTEDYLASLAEQVKIAAQSQGYAVGWAEGRRKAAAEAAVIADANAAAFEEQQRAWNEQHEAAMRSLNQAVAALQQAATDIVIHVDGRALDFAELLVATLLGHELRLEGGADVLRRALASVELEHVVDVRLHPAAVGEARAESIADGGAVRVVADETLEPGDALVTLTDTVIDLRMSEALARIQAALR